MKQDKIKEKGEVLEALPGLLFKVKLESGEETLGYLGGKMKMFKIKIVPRDKVLVERSPYDKNRGRIVYRLK